MNEKSSDSLNDYNNRGLGGSAIKPRKQITSASFRDTNMTFSEKTDNDTNLKSFQEVTASLSSVPHIEFLDLEKKQRSRHFISKDTFSLPNGARFNSGLKENMTGQNSNCFSQADSNYNDTHSQYTV